MSGKLMRIFIVGSCEAGIGKVISAEAERCGESVSVESCTTIYELAVQMAGAGSQGVIVGRFEVLAVENGRLFELAGTGGYRILCLATPSQRELLRSLAGFGQWVIGVTDAAEVGFYLKAGTGTTWLMPERTSPRFSISAGIAEKGHLLSEQELSALLDRNFAEFPV